MEDNIIILKFRIYDLRFLFYSFFIFLFSETEAKNDIYDFLTAIIFFKEKTKIWLTVSTTKMEGDQELIESD